MKLTHFPIEFTQAKPVLQAITSAGYQAYFVGGSVRDALLGKPLHDVDIATSAYPAEIKQIFKRTVDTGIKHGTVTVLQQGQAYEVTTFRTESAYQDFRRPDHVTFVRSLREDLKRRDFTINALALQHDGTIIDLFSGLADLKARLIRAVGDPNQRFHEDALRMMRAVRFKSQLNFKIESQTQAAISNQHQLLQKIAVERVHDELIKLMLGKNWTAGLNSFIATQLYQTCPGLSTAKKALFALTTLPTVPLKTEGAVWLLFAHQLGLTPKTVKPFLKQWKSANNIIQSVSRSLPLLDKFLAQQNLSNWDYYYAGLPIVLLANQIAQLYGLGAAPAQLQKRYHQLPIQQRRQLALDGGDLLHHLALQPGPQLGELLAKLEQQVVAGNLPNNRQALLQSARSMLN